MARPWFKRRWTRIVPEPAERTSFVLAASLVLALLFLQWRPVGGTVWNLPGPGAGALWAAYAAGWAVAISSTFLISHSDLFGLRQAWLHARHVSLRRPSLGSQRSEETTGIRRYEKQDSNHPGGGASTG
jgi:hypothetical protein